MPASDDRTVKRTGNERASGPIYTPETLNELFGLMRSMPEARIAAGGTYLLSGAGDPPAGPLLSLHRIEELRRMSRTDRHLDIGAATSIRAITRAGPKMLPSILSGCLPAICPFTLRGLATLGGNICIWEVSRTGTAALNALGALVEIRRPGKGRWVPMPRFRSAGGLSLEREEVVTRIRIPLEPHDVGVFESLGPNLSFCAAARREKGNIDDIRIVLGTGTPWIIRDRELEAELIGRKLPMGPREIETTANRIATMAQSDRFPFNPLDIYRARSVTAHFLRALGEPSTRFLPRTYGKRKNSLARRGGLDL